jgi:hypothetical protein
MGIVISIAYICSAVSTVRPLEVVGLGSLNAIKQLTGGTYTVEFDSMDGSGRRETRDFSDEELRPYGPGR